MARTVVSYFHNYELAVQSVEDLLANNYDPELIRIAFEPERSSDTIDYDNTKEQAPLIGFREVTFGAEITEEDADYYSAVLDKGDVLVSVHIPTDPTQERGWEEETAEVITNFLKDGGAYDCESRKVYSNRGLTTYPQNRWIDPTMGRPNLKKDRIYESRSPLNGEVSNVIGTPDTSDYLQELEDLSGRRVLNANELMALRNRPGK